MKNDNSEKSGFISNFVELRKMQFNLECRIQMFKRFQPVLFYFVLDHF